MSDTGLQSAEGVWPDVHSGTARVRGNDPGRIRPDVSGKPRFPLRAEPAWDDGVLPETDGADGGEGSLPGWGRDPSRGGNRDGGPLRQARGRGDRDGPCFALAVPPNGYAWWYIDGVSEDGSRAVSVIAFIGSVFSPWYRWSGRRDPANHCCINVATYGPGGPFTMNWLSAGPRAGAGACPPARRSPACERGRARRTAPPGGAGCSPWWAGAAGGPVGPSPRACRGWC